MPTLILLLILFFLIAAVIGLAVYLIITTPTPNPNPSPNPGPLIPLIPPGTTPLIPLNPPTPNPPPPSGAVRVIPVPNDIITIRGVSDLAGFCQDQGLTLMTQAQMQTFIQNYNYAYCQRGYIQEGTIIPASSGTSAPGCPGSGLNFQPLTLPCTAVGGDSDLPNCETVVFCTTPGTL